MRWDGTGLRNRRPTSHVQIYTEHYVDRRSPFLLPAISFLRPLFILPPVFICRPLLIVCFNLVNRITSDKESGREITIMRMTWRTDVERIMLNKPCAVPLEKSNNHYRVSKQNVTQNRTHGSRVWVLWAASCKVPTWKAQLDCTVKKHYNINLDTG
jgi:hypothetical protein